MFCSVLKKKKHELALERNSTKPTKKHKERTHTSYYYHLKYSYSVFCKGTQTMLETSL